MTPPNHKALRYARLYFYGAQEGTRTPTHLTGLAPETSASTNSATWATALF